MAAAKGDQAMSYVLVVDDDAAVCALAATALREAGYPVLTAEDGLAALAAIIEACPSLVLLDPSLPALRGFEMVVWLREAGMMAPIVLLSREEQRRTADVTPAVDAYLPKPFARDDLLVLVARFLPAPDA
jgi:DNA-binding response OmpR family regulator